MLEDKGVVHLAKAEVEHVQEIRLAVPGHQEQVGGLEPQVIQALLVRGGQRPGRLLHQVADQGRLEPRGGQLAALPAGQVLPLQVAGDHERLAGRRGAEVLDRDQLGVQRPGGDLRLAVEGGQGLGALGNDSIHQLQDAPLIAAQIADLVHRAPGAFADAPDHPVRIADRRADRKLAPFHVGGLRPSGIA
jgi:hypothetical protein